MHHKRATEVLLLKLLKRVIKLSTLYAKSFSSPEIITHGRLELSKYPNNQLIKSLFLYITWQMVCAGHAGGA